LTQLHHEILVGCIFCNAQNLQGKI